MDSKNHIKYVLGSTNNSQEEIDFFDFDFLKKDENILIIKNIKHEEEQEEIEIKSIRDDEFQKRIKELTRKIDFDKEEILKEKKKQDLIQQESENVIEQNQVIINFLEKILKEKMSLESQKAEL